MKKNIKLLSAILIIGAVLISCNQNNESKFTKLQGPYLGQKPPGMEAEMFAPGLLSSGGSSELNITFSPDGMEFCYSLIAGGEESHLSEPRGPFLHRFIMFSHRENDHWTEPIEFPFIQNHKEWYPNFSPGGKRIYFNSKRNETNPLDSSSPYIWYVERLNGDWTEPKEIDFGEDYQGWTGVKPSVAANGNLYFALFPDRMNGFIYMSRYENGKYSFPEQLSDTINNYVGNHPYIAPDESYLLFDRKDDLFISFRDENGKWMKPQNLGESVNTGYLERRPFVSFDEKYLFFASNRINPELPDKPITLKDLQQLTNVPANGYQHIYWVDAKVIEELRPDDL